MRVSFFKPHKNTKQDANATMLIAVVGRTGSGLSQLIHDLTGSYQDGVAPEDSLSPDPHTTNIREVTALVKAEYYRRRVTLIDTPGFDYSRNNDEHTKFEQLAEWLRRRYGSKVTLDGVIYMHNIQNEELYQRSPFHTSKPLEELCGRNWRRKIIFVNSHWDETIGEEKENCLKGGYWNFMLGRGSKMLRYESPGDCRRAQKLLEYLADPPSVYLR